MAVMSPKNFLLNLISPSIFAAWSSNCAAFLGISLIHSTYELWSSRSACRRWRQNH